MRKRPPFSSVLSVPLFFAFARPSNAIKINNRGSASFPCCFVGHANEKKCAKPLRPSSIGKIPVRNGEDPSWNERQKKSDPPQSLRLQSQKRRTPSSIATGLRSGGSEDDETSDDAASEKLKSRILLATVAFLYGTLNVCLRQLYALPGPPSASALSLTRGWLAAACFVPLVIPRAENERDPQILEEEREKQYGWPFWLAALELAIWNFGAQGLVNVGLLYTESARASFLTQTSVIITPLISLLAGQKVNKSVWIGCGFALSGLVLLAGGDGAASSFAGMLNFSSGDLLVLGGALSWSMYLFRVSNVGSRFKEIPLQAMKTAILATMYTSWFTVSAFQCYSLNGSWADVMGLWVGWDNIVAWALLAYSAIGPGALADVLQQRGQKNVSASEANVILSAEPVFTAICARLVLGEVTSMRENVGGALIVFAALLASCK